MPRKKEASFETNILQLEEIVTKLEDSDATLEEIMANYTKGMELSAKCLKALDTANKQIDVLLQEQDGKVLEQELSIEGAD